MQIQWESFVVRPLGVFRFQASFDGVYFQHIVTSLKFKKCYWLLVTPDQFSRSDD